MQSVTTSKFPTLLARAREKFQLFRDGKPQIHSWILLIGIVLVLFFNYRLAPFPIWIRFPAALVTAVLFSGLLLIVFGKLILRYQSGKSLIPEMLLGTVFCAILILDGWGLTLSGAGLTYLFWVVMFLILLLLFLRRSRLYFYLLFSGLTLFVLVFFSFRIIDLEKTGMLAAYQFIWKTAASRYRSYDIQTGEGGLLRVQTQNRTVLLVRIPESLHLHGSESLQETDGPGIPILAVSSDAKSLDRVPSAILYEIPANLNREVMRNRTELVLGSVKDEQVQELRKEKEQTLFPPDFPITMEGSFWTYYDRFQADTLRTGFFIFGKSRSAPRDGADGKEFVDPRFLLWIREPVEAGFPFHPRTLELLRGLSLPALSNEPAN
ncbi:MAG: hypothetical protein RH862_03390 [Leptospiraceae bacterium]